MLWAPPNWAAQLPSQQRPWYDTGIGNGVSAQSSSAIQPESGHEFVRDASFEQVDEWNTKAVDFHACGITSSGQSATDAISSRNVGGRIAADAMRLADELHLAMREAQTRAAVVAQVSSKANELYPNIELFERGRSLDLLSFACPCNTAVPYVHTSRLPCLVLNLSEDLGRVASQRALRLCYAAGPQRAPSFWHGSSLAFVNFSIELVDFLSRRSSMIKAKAPGFSEMVHEYAERRVSHRDLLAVSAALSLSGHDTLVHNRFFQFPDTDNGGSCLRSLQESQRAVDQEARELFCTAPIGDMSIDERLTLSSKILTEDDAAVRIQRTYRRHTVRWAYLILLRLVQQLQAIFRGGRARSVTKQRWRSRTMAAIAIQLYVRRRKLRFKRLRIASSSAKEEARFSSNLGKENVSPARCQNSQVFSEPGTPVKKPPTRPAPDWEVVSLRDENSQVVTEQRSPMHQPHSKPAYVEELLGQLEALQQDKAELQRELSKARLLAHGRSSCDQQREDREIGLSMCSSTQALPLRSRCREQLGATQRSRTPALALTVHGAPLTEQTSVQRSSSATSLTSSSRCSEKIRVVPPTPAALQNLREVARRADALVDHPGHQSHTADVLQHFKYRHDTPSAAPARGAAPPPKTNEFGRHHTPGSRAHSSSQSARRRNASRGSPGAAPLSSRDARQVCVKELLSRCDKINTIDGLIFGVERAAKKASPAAPVVVEQQQATLHSRCPARTSTRRISPTRERRASPRPATFEVPRVAGGPCMQRRPPMRV